MTRKTNIWARNWARNWALAGPFAIATALVLTVVSAHAVEVIRGDALDQTVSSSVVVLRGAAPKASAHPTLSDPAPQSARITAGDTFWALDDDGRGITACNLIKTASVGRDRIACWRRDFRKPLTD